MAKVLFLVQLIVALVVLPLWPGLDPAYASRGLLFLGLVLAVPFAAVVATAGLRTALRALTDVWSHSASPTTARAWEQAAAAFPAAGALAGLAALGGSLHALDPARPLAPQILVLAFFCLIWGVLGLLLGRILHQNALKTLSAPLLVLTPAFSRRFGLTPRETEAAQAVLDGLTYQGAADKLSVSPATIKSHVLSVYQKTGAGNKIELLRLVEAENGRIHQSVDGAPALSPSS